MHYISIDMNDEVCLKLSEIIKDSKVLKVLKILKSKVTDEGLSKIVDKLEYSRYSATYLSY
jgi:hypothetical protein